VQAAWLLEQVRKLCGQAREYGAAYRHPGAQVPHDTRDAIVDFVNRWSDKTGLAVACFLVGLGIATPKWYSWKNRYGKANEPSAWIPRDHWLEEAERQALVAFHGQFPPEGYRRLTFLMLDRDVVACSPASVYRVLKGAGLLDRHTPRPPPRARGSSNPCNRIGTGTRMSPTSPPAAPSTTSAASLADTAVTSPTGRSGRR
jgi:hypothetical protein